MMMTTTTKTVAVRILCSINNEKRERRKVLQSCEAISDGKFQGSATASVLVKKKKNTAEEFKLVLSEERKWQTSRKGYYSVSIIIGDGIYEGSYVLM